MKKVWLFLLATLFLVGGVSATCSSPDKLIMKLSGPTNAHGAVWDYNGVVESCVNLSDYSWKDQGIENRDVYMASGCQSTKGGNSVCDSTTLSQEVYRFDGAVARYGSSPVWHGSSVTLNGNSISWTGAGLNCGGDYWTTADVTVYECIYEPSASFCSSLDLPTCQSTAGCDWVSNPAYNFPICYEGVAPAIPHPVCNGANSFLWLSDVYNAHASTTQSAAYNTGVCYGGLSCAVRDNSCNAGEEMVVALSSTSNAHLSDPDYLPSGVISYWKLDGDVTDSVGSNDGTNNGASFVGGQVGQAGDFDGVADHILVNDVTDFMGLSATGLTVSSWVNFASDSGADSPDKHTIVQLENDDPSGSTTRNVFHFKRGLDNKIGMGMPEADGSANSLSGNKILNNNEWYHVVSTWDGSTRSIYIDGVLDVTDSRSGALSNVQGPLRIGGDTDDGRPLDDTLHGMIDEVVIYNRALTAQEVQDRYNVGAYEKKVCCGVSAASAIRWEDMDGNPITTSNIGQWVRMVKTSASSGDFEIREDDGTSGDDDLYIGNNNISGFSENGNRVGIWHITQADFDVADEGIELDDHQIEAYFTIGVNVSGNLNISDQYIDYPMNVTLESPICGENFTLGSTTWINVTASDPNDEILGNVTIGGVKIMDFTNGGNSTTHTWNQAGNIQVEVFANNSRGYIRRTITSIMVTDGTTKDYVAACIDKPADFSDITSNNVKFEAESSRGLRCTLGVCSEVDVEGLWFSWRFSDGLINFNHDGAAVDGDGVPTKLAYNFFKNFATGGHNWAILDVKMV